MPKTKKKPTKFCTMPQVAPRTFASHVHPGRASLILQSAKKWVNGTVLHYCFLTTPASFKGKAQHLDLVRKGFHAWKKLDIGLEFEEVDDASEAEIRIGFLAGDGHWSYIGRDALGFGVHERTMNLDKTDAWDIDTAVHEIGHSLGLPHEHQNPNAGIVWDEEAVYAALAGYPNYWSRQKTFYNIIRKIDPDTVQGSSWDPDSVMHYPFEAGLIKEPVKYQNGLTPKRGLSDRDREWIRSFYPPLEGKKLKELKPFKSERLTLQPAEQVDFVIEPDATRTYTIATFGHSDAVLVLFEDVNGTPRYLTADDDSGEDLNASICTRLRAGRKYVLRLRLYWQFAKGDVGVMLW